MDGQMVNLSVINERLKKNEKIMENLSQSIFKLENITLFQNEVLQNLTEKVAIVQQQAGDSDKGILYSGQASDMEVSRIWPAGSEARISEKGRKDQRRPHGQP